MNINKYYVWVINHMTTKIIAGAHFWIRQMFEVENNKIRFAHKKLKGQHLHRIFLFYLFSLIL